VHIATLHEQLGRAYGSRRDGDAAGEDRALLPCQQIQKIDPISVLALRCIIVIIVGVDRHDLRRHMLGTDFGFVTVLCGE
jgi:hypothetical protein